MKRSRSQYTKYALVASIMSIVLCVSVFAGATFAWFTFNVTNENNTINAGTFKAGLYARDLAATEESAYGAVGPDTPLFNSVVKWEPGVSHGFDFKVTNEGDIDLNWEFSLVNIQSSGSPDIAGVLDVYVLSADKNDDAALTQDTYIGTLAGLRSDGVVKEGSKLTENASEEFSVVIRMREGIGTEYEGTSVTFAVKLSATQSSASGQVAVTPDPGQPDDASANGKLLREAIDAAAPGATVTVAEGTYEFTDALILTKPVTLQGSGDVVLDLSSVQTPTGGDWASNTSLLIAAQDVTLKNMTIIGQAGKASIVTVGFDSMPPEHTITLSDGTSYAFEGGVGEFAPDYANIYENVNFVNCTFRLESPAEIGTALFLETRYSVVKDCTFENIQATSAVVKIEEDHTKVLNPTFASGCTGTTILEDWCAVGTESEQYGDGNEYPGHPFVCQEGWAGMTGDGYAKHVAYAQSKGWTHNSEMN